MLLPLNEVQRLQWKCNGVLQVDNLLSNEEVIELRDLYDSFVNGTLDVSKHRYDLGAGEAKKLDTAENITQIMWPSDIVPSLREHPMRKKCEELVRYIYEDETFDFDFDMLIAKAPNSDTPTPPHQDQAYWVELEDKRAVSIWISLDEATLENGCMWYSPRSHLGPLRKHWRAGDNPNAGLTCEATEDEMSPMPLQPGAAGLHAGRTLHYSRGNKTNGWRRAYIINFRPRAMIDAERSQGFDHGRAGHKVHAVRSEL